MKDVVVVNELRRRGTIANDIKEILKYEAVERKPRVLDKPPKKLNFVKASDITQYGCCSEFILCYNDIKASTDIEQAVVELPGNKRFCDVKVYIALQALITQGYSNSMDRATACFEVFKAIVMTPGDTITVERVKNTLSKYQPNSYYESELVKALQVCILDEKISVVYWVSSCECEGFYSSALELGKEIIRSNCDTEEDVVKFLKPILKDAKQDEEFMSKIYKEAANKFLIPILFMLKDTHPEVLDPGS